MLIRKAKKSDIPSLIRLLYQVHLVHSEGRPDIFRRGSKKYTEEELCGILSDARTPVLVAEERGAVLGYAFCVFEEVKDNASLVDRKSLYIDDICVDENARGGGIGRALYKEVLALAKDEGCYHVTLNVWKLNEGAMRFYEKCGMSPLKVTMEQIL